MASSFGSTLDPQNDDASVIDPGTKVGAPKPVEWWKEDGVPEGAHSESLFTVDSAGVKHFAGPTHYHHLADGRVIGGYSGGTVYSEPGPDGKDKLTRIAGIYEG